MNWKNTPFGKVLLAPLRFVRFNWIVIKNCYLSNKFSLKDGIVSTTYRGVPIKFYLWDKNFSDWFGLHFYNVNGDCDGYVLKRDIKEDDVVFDVGSYHGHFALYASQKAKNGKVYAFEPDPKNRAVLKKNLELNGITNVVVVPDILTAYVGFAQFNSEGTGISQISPEGNDTLRCTTLQAFCQENNIPKVDFVKMDIEGAEVGVVVSSLGFIKHNVKHLAIASYHPYETGHTSDALEKIFRDENIDVSTEYEQFHKTTYASTEVV